MNLQERFTGIIDDIMTCKKKKSKKQLFIYNQKIERRPHE